VDQTARKGSGGGCTIKMSIIDHTLIKYMLFHTYLDLLPLNFVYLVLENNISLAVGTMTVLNPD